MTQIITDNLQARTRPVPLCSPHKLSAPAPVCHGGLWWAGCSLSVLCRSPQRGFDISVWLAKRLTLILAICASDASNLAVTLSWSPPCETSHIGHIDAVGCFVPKPFKSQGGLQSLQAKSRFNREAIRLVKNDLLLVNPYCKIGAPNLLPEEQLPSYLAPSFPRGCGKCRFL